jgi:hypothetical protein
MKNLDHLPKPTDLMEKPQLAVLAALDTTLVAALRALLAEHADLLDDLFPRKITAADYWAERLIDLGRQLPTALMKYRSVLEAENQEAQSFDDAF